MSKEEKAAWKIQAMAKVFLNKLRFRQSLYKLILFKNIVETKIHKEKMQLLFAFEQMIINTEDQDTQEQIEYAQEEIDGDDPYFRDQIAQLYNPLYNGMTDA